MVFTNIICHYDGLLFSVAKTAKRLVRLFRDGLFILLVKLPNFISLPVPYYVTFCANAFGFVLGYMVHKYSSVIESRKTVFVSLSILTGAFILMSCHEPLSKEIAANALVVIAFCGMPVIDAPIVRAISKTLLACIFFIRLLSILPLCCAQIFIHWSC